ncbi:MAG: secretin and TonB N-terminal domain-containing protein [Candidatus Omnitrophica bacterium]|nr:secretin and TonB N-terminal domain-containing protein [Candidatus Omnitrophota bacterium]
MKKGKNKAKAGVKYSLLFLIFTVMFSLNAFAQEGASGDSSAAVAADPEPDMPFEQRLDMRISLDYKDADLLTVLRSLSWTYKLNIVTSPDIKGKVSISLKDVTVKEALEAIITVNGLAYSMRKNIIYISQGDAEALELVSEVIFLKYMKAADAQNILRKAVSAKGDIKIDEVANSLIITDFPSNIRKVEILLEKVDIPPRQVLIEAKIVDITSSALEAIGVTYNFEYAPGTGLFERNTKYAEELDGTMSLSEQSSDLTGGQFSLNTLTFKHFTLTATLDALARDGKANVLASPSIAVLNGQEARIIIGERYPYKERTQTTTGTTETTKFVDIGTTLRVTPQINDDGYITMQVHPEVSSLAAALDAGPRVTTREADTTVRVKAGETLLIGGLIKQDDASSVDKIPYLGDLPFIGYLFSRSEHEIEQKELAVFITPTILYSREEKEKELGYEGSRRHEVFVNLNKPAKLNMVEQLYFKARQLDRGRAPDSVRKDKKVRKDQALGLYEHIYYGYPDSMRAPEALLYAGKIYMYYYKKYRYAKEAFARVISDYPDTDQAVEAKDLYRQVEETEKKEKGVVTRVAPFEARPLRAIGDIMPPRMLNLNIFGNGDD